MACGILVPRPGFKPGPPAVEAWSPNHWTARAPKPISFKSYWILYEDSLMLLGRGGHGPRCVLSLHTLLGQNQTYIRYLVHFPFSDEVLKAGAMFPMERADEGHGAVGLECWMRHLHEHPHSTG